MMNPSHWLLCTTLIAGSAAAAGTPPELYIRGAFNGWGTDNQLRYLGQGQYETQFIISPGYHAFKVGNKDWTAEWVINPAASVAVTPGSDYRMATQPGPEDYLFVKKTASYKFTLDISDPAAPLLRVTRFDTAPDAAFDPHRVNQGRTALEFKTFDGKVETARFSSWDPAAPLRSYAHSTTMSLRDPGPQAILYQETKEMPRVRSGNLAFDALFALAATEMKQASVREIRDGNYSGGAAIACDCFETGEKWHYVWTRDLSYAATLGLAMLDPQRVKNSLDFKLSGYRSGIDRAAPVAGSADGLQVIQDTGSGGSWPVSTDRVSWAFGAEEVLKSLPPAERAAFAPRALKALSNTIENDRLAAFDADVGLYNGEQSFLDWRDQSYAAWITGDIASLASSKALSTNVAHYKALTLAAALAQELGDAELADKYGAWAGHLKDAINDYLWLDDKGLYSSLTAPHLDGTPTYKFDWLGQALAVITGVAPPERARQVLANYPHGPMGAPVIFPQQQDMPVYHNRAIWPFVTAFGLKAAAMTGNVSVADAGYDTLMRGAALNMSNMENLEWLSGQPVLLDEQHPALIGPVINSKRQLWSVGAYLGMVIGDVFGVSTTNDGISLRPFVTAKLRRDTFGASSVIALDNLQLHGKRLKITMLLPAPSTSNGFYAPGAITLNGAPAGASLRWDQLGPDNDITIELGALQPGQKALRRVEADPYSPDARNVFAPREAFIAAIARDKAGKNRIVIAPDKNPPDTVYNLYRDGELLAEKVSAAGWTDRSGSAYFCYAAEAQDPVSGNRSHHSPAVCADPGVEIAITDARVASNLRPSPPDARFSAPRLQDWGKPGDRFAVNGIRIAKAGNYQLQIRYHNGANQINLGISGGVKWLAVKDASGRVAAQGVVQLPHARLEKADTPTVLSTPLAATLKAGQYSLELSDFYNMSYLQSNSTFSAAGGTDGPSNKFDIYGVRILRVK